MAQKLYNVRHQFKMCHRSIGADLQRGWLGIFRRRWLVESIDRNSGFKSLGNQAHFLALSLLCYCVNDRTFVGLGFLVCIMGMMVLTAQSC